MRLRESTDYEKRGQAKTGGSRYQAPQRYEALIANVRCITLRVVKAVLS